MNRHVLAAFAALAALSACATTPTRSERMMAMCPMGVADAQVSAVDEVDGTTLTFTTHHQVGELQRRVGEMAAMHNDRHHGGMVLEGAPQGRGHGMDDGTMRATHVSVTNLANGASVRVTPNDPADLLKVQASIRAHADKMQHHSCRMMNEPYGS